MTLSLPLQAGGQTPVTPHGAVWDAWQPLAGGFMARRRVPARLELPPAERRSPLTQERLRPGASVRPWDRLAVWLYTEAAGLYGVGIEELAGATGVAASTLRAEARAGRLKVANAGAGVGWYFDAASDRLVFAGETYRTFHAEGNAYHLRQTQTPDPDRMVERHGQRQPPQGQALAFRESLHFEEEKDLMYALWLDPANPDARYWFWDYLYGSVRPRVELPLRAPSPAAKGSAVLRVRLHGFTDVYPGNEHRVSVELNGRPVGSSVEWDGLNPAELVVDFDQSLLDPSGANTLALVHALASSHPRSGQFLESVDLEYWRLPVADNGQLWVRGAAGGVQEVRGFSGRDILVIESPLRGGVVRRDVRTYASDGGWAVAFEAERGKDYLVAEVAGVRPAVVDPRPQADLLSGSNRAGYLIIAPREFEGTAQALASLRQSSSGPVLVAWLDDIYKSFSHGRVDPFAVGRFIAHARSAWALAPSTVTLLGKGSLDRKNRMGYGDNFLPVLMTANPWALAESDARLLGFADGVVPFAYGRIPIVNDAEGRAYVAKLRAAEARAGGAPRQGVVTADNPDSAGDFHADAEGIASQLEGLGFAAVTRAFHPLQPVRQVLTSSSSWETAVVSYSGHGSNRQVGTSRENFLTGEDAAGLANTPSSLFVALTCAVGGTAAPGVRSLTGELVLNSQGGASAALAPSGLATNTDAHALGAAFFEHVFRRGSSVGAALAAATAQTRGGISGFTAPVYSIIGDPAVGTR